MSIFSTILAAAATFIIAVISSMGYGGVVLLMAIESACIPLPSEIIMPFAGYLVSTGELSLIGVATAGAIGCNLGSIPAYALGQYGGRAAVVRYGRYVLMSGEDLDRAERFFARFGGLAVLIGRLLPVVRTFIAVPAGVARMNHWRFHIYTFVGSWPWCFVLAWLGMKLGENWRDDPTLSNILHRMDFVIVGVGVAAVAWFVWHRLKHRVKV
jgi:membrane protein DedA with SNARE-associated domain